MDVTVQLECGRCSKSAARSLSLDEAQSIVERAESKEELAEDLTSQLNTILTDDHPSLVIAVRQADGTYTVKTLDDLCDAPDAKRNKGCKARVDALIKDIFMENPPTEKKRKPSAKKKKVTKDPEEPTE